jgi:hypothetical protein
MKNFFAVITAVVLIGNALVIVSCAGLSPQTIDSAPVIPEGAVPQEQPAESAPKPSGIVERPGAVERPPERPEPSGHIMGKGIVPEEKLAAFLLHTNAGADEDFVRQLAGFYVEEAAAEGVNHDTAFAQMCLETGFLRYGGLVTPDMNNFCGLGATGPEQTGLIFPDPRTGVRAHIQHLQAYASTEPLNQELIDPRYRYVKRGSAPTIQGLAGTWATDRLYDVKIDRILKNLYEF